MDSTITINHQRISYIDQIKGFAIFLVVIGHSLENLLPGNPPGGILRELIYSFHMPLFFMISGMLFHTPINLWTAIKKKFIKLIVPFIIWGILFSLYLYGNLSDFFIEGKVHHMWFIIILFECYLVHNLINLCFKRLHIRPQYEIMAFIFIIFLMEIIKRITNPSYSLISFTQFTVMYRFYVLGYFFKFLTKEVNHKSIIILFIASFITTFIYNHYHTANIITFTICAISGSMLLYSIFKYNILHITKQNLRRLEYLGKYSIFFYLGHMFFLKYKLIDTSTLSEFFIIFLAIIITLTILFIMNYLLKVVLKNRVCSFLLLGRN